MYRSRAESILTYEITSSIVEAFERPYSVQAERQSQGSASSVLVLYEVPLT